VDKALEMGKTSTVGSLQSFLGTSSSTIIRAVGAIILGLFILDSDYGLYAVALIPATTLALFQDWGIGSALTRYCAKYRATNELIEQKKVIIAGLVFAFATGLILWVVSLLTANFFAFSVYNKPASAFLIILASVTMFSGALSSAVASVFTGFEQMKLNSYLAVIAAIVYTLLTPLLVILGYGATGAIIGFTLSSVVQGIISIIFVYFFTLRKLPSYKINKFEIRQTLKLLLNYGVPLGIGNIVSNLGSPVFSFLMAKYVSEAMIGNYKIATNFVVLLTFLTVPINNVLFPAFSKLNPQNESSLLRTIFASSVKYTNLLLVPAVMAMVVLAAPLIGTLYGNKWSYAPPFLALSVVFYLLTLIGNRSMGGLLSAMGETKLLMKQSVLSLIIGIPTAFLLVPPLGIVGIILGLPLAALPSMFIGLYVIWNHYGAKADFGASAKIFFASALATVVVYLFLSFFVAAYWVLLFVGAILFLGIYLISVPLFGAVNQSDLGNFRTLFSGLGRASKLLEIPIKIIERLVKIRGSLFKTRRQ
jgi:O-antigen/teichoic acid export membrane protein